MIPENSSEEDSISGGELWFPNEGSFLKVSLMTRAWMSLTNRISLKEGFEGHCVSNEEDSKGEDLKESSENEQWRLKEPLE